MLYDTDVHRSKSDEQPAYNLMAPTLFEYLRDVHSPPIVTLDINSDHIIVQNKVITDFKANVVQLYIKILNMNVQLETPIILIKRYRTYFDKLYKMFNIDCLYEASSTLKIAISNLDVVSKSEQSRLYLFLHYLKSGVILLPTNNVSAGRSIIHDMPLDEYNIKYGGHVYSRPGLYENFVACIDFSSFYPSIYSAFNLSFDNIAIVMGNDLIKIFNNNTIFYEYMQSFGIMFRMDETYATAATDDVIVADMRYILIMKSQQNVSVGGLCQEFINLRSTTSGNSSKVHKNLINTLCGCIGSDRFSLRSNDLYNVNTFLGRRIVLFACSKIMLDDIKTVNVEEAARLFFYI